MRIVYIISNTNLYGSELHLFDLIKSLSEDNQIKLITFSEGPLINKVKNECSNVDIITINSTWGKGLFNIRKISREIRSFNPHIVHSHQPLAIFLGSISAKVAGKPHISTIHSTPNVNAFEHTGIKSKLVYGFHYSIQCLAEVLSAGSIFITQYNKDRYSFCKKKGIVIYNWISERFGSIVPLNKTENDAVNFLSASSINKGKGVKEMLVAFKNINHKIKYQLTIAGTGNKELVDQLEQYVIDNGLNDQIYFIGYQANLAPFFQQSDSFVLFTKAEAFGLVFVEAMAFGLTVVCTDLPQLREIVPEGNFFIDLEKGFDDEMLQKIINKDYRDRIAAININKAKSEFNQAKQIFKVMQLYKSIVKD